MNALPRTVGLVIKSVAPRDFFERELKRPFKLVREPFDSGACQVTNFEIDWNETFQKAGMIQRSAARRLGPEVQFLLSERIDAVVTDVASPPLEAAREAGVPSIAIANFTWVEIFQRAAKGNPERLKLLDDYRRQYAMADQLLRTNFEFPMPYFERVRNIPLIARQGKSIRKELDRVLGIPSGRRLVLLYFGKWTNGEMNADSLKRMKDVVFVAMSPFPDPVHVLDGRRYSFEDVVASADAVLAKPGYGTIGECMANGTPVVYYPRPEFAEYRVMRPQMLEWGGAVEIPMRAFLSGRWEKWLEMAFRISPGRVRCDGAAVAARALTRILEQVRS